MGEGTRTRGFDLTCLDACIVEQRKEHIPGPGCTRETGSLGSTVHSNRESRIKPFDLGTLRVAEMFHQLGLAVREQIRSDTL